MKIRAVLFDLDGTLLDSLDDIGESMNLVLSGMGLATHALGEYRGFVGDGIAMLALRSLPAGRRDEAMVADCVARMRGVYAGRATQKTRPYEGIPQLLDLLDAKRVALAVLSNKPHQLTVDLVEKLLPRWSFAAVFGERAGVPRKPDPAGALEIAELLRFAPSSILYVGDTPTDLATARAAGMPAIGAAWGFRSEAQLVAAGATAIARSPADLASYLT